MTSRATPIPLLPFTADGPLVGAQGLGCMGMSEFYGATDETEARATLELALDLGVTMFDTADMYGLGANEAFLAPFFRAHRDRAMVATKFGYARTAAHPDDWSLDNRPAFIRAAVEQSLRRLGVEVIDLYYMHRRDPAIPLAESIGAMARLVEEGKVRWIGLCAVSAAELRDAHAIHPIAALQSEWSLFTRDIETEIVPAAKQLGVTLVPYSPLGRGMLTGQAFAAALEEDDARQYFPRFAPDNLAANSQLVGEIARIARALEVTPAQLALAWLYNRAEMLGAKIIPIPGTRKRTRLMENLAALSLRLSRSTMDALEPLAGAVQGIAI
ncbi:aldo/keto reductase [Sphingobium sp. AP49]|uniref:aldo/keto reductase n=1 Tax=Sphingobium sp. AP49 TaxID=1144307 RepID=UPI00026ED5BF|nr:aldo/keto reductase [Sphingobium sp. AP49]WHO40092.1 aldo/keto reductase [Sphingobium sp. AP49]